MCEPGFKAEPKPLLHFFVLPFSLQKSKQLIKMCTVWCFFVLHFLLSGLGQVPPGITKSQHFLRMCTSESGK